MYRTELMNKRNRRYRLLLLPAAGGGLSYQDTVIADAPKIYYTLGEADPGDILTPTTKPATDVMGFETGGFYREQASGQLTFQQTSILPDASGNSLVWTGTSSAGVYIDDNDAYTPTNGFSIEAWVRVDGTIVGNFPIIAKEIGGSFAEWKINIQTDRTLRMRLGSQNGATNSLDLDTTTPLTLGEVYHIVATLDKSDDKARIYINGSEEVVSAAWPYNPYNGSGLINIGVFGASTSYRGAVTMQEAAWYDKTLSAAQVLAHYQAGGGT